LVEQPIQKADVSIGFLFLVGAIHESLEKRLIRLSNSFWNLKSTFSGGRRLNCHPETADFSRRLKSSLRDLRVGAFYLLDFGKGEKSAECRVKSLSVSRLPKP
jgi:hypothetical protein